MTREIWAELSASMRLLRTNAGVSLRQTEAATGRGRGTLSQIETGKSRPNRSLVEWYDTHLGGDGLLLSMYAEARTAHSSGPLAADPPPPTAAPDVVVDGQLLANGVRVTAGAPFEAGWTLRNTGRESWRDRAVRRVGAHGAVRMLTSAASVPIEECPPGARVDVRVTMRAPAHCGTFAAYWDVVDDRGRRRGSAALLAVVVVSGW
ncbi:NBR1-Ig-like domain-containing protein [uncultured Jatrophihabitans sp.]|uniref:NBR1-Ig-like domain-containing protein n=1 Tax=uncultured Jatrophihabitans sp. TaxID=1610747 RepID=UPI0035CC1218